METTIKQKLREIEEQAISFGSFGPCPYTLMVTEKRTSPVLQYLETYSDSMPYQLSHMVGIFKRLDFNFTDLREYYTASTELMDTNPELKAMALAHIQEKVSSPDSLEVWIDRQVAMFEGYISSLIAYQNIKIQVADPYDLKFVANTVPQQSTIKLVQAFWVV